jgi:hypothetical protein
MSPEEIKIFREKRFVYLLGRRHLKKGSHLQVSLSVWDSCGGDVFEFLLGQRSDSGLSRFSSDPLGKCWDDFLPQISSHNYIRTTGIKMKLTPTTFSLDFHTKFNRNPLAKF